MVFAEANKILQFISAFMLIFLVFYILSQKKGKASARYFLSGFFLSRALIIVFFASYFYPGLKKVAPDLYVLGYPVLFLYAPFLFLYTRSATSNNFTTRWYDSLHFIPFLLVLAYFVGYFHFYNLDEKIMLLNSRELFEPFIVNGLMLWIQFAVYTLACVYILVEYRIKIKLFNSSYDHELLNWLLFLVGAFLIWKGIFVSGYLFGIFKGVYANSFKIFIELGFLFYASMITLKGLKIPHVILSIDENKSYGTSPLTADDRQAMIVKINDVIKKDKPFLDPNLTLNRLAELCHIPVHHLSQILNTNLKQNFYSYINNLRVEEAKKMLKDPAKSRLTVLEILYETGFNSKSVFNKVFKSNTGMTPTSYRKKHLNKAVA